MVTGSVTAGSGVRGVIVCGPAPAMLKLITSGTFVERFADKIACRSEPAPLSLVLVTTKVAHHPGPNSAAPNRNAMVLARRMKPFSRFVFMTITYESTLMRDFIPFHSLNK